MPAPARARPVDVGLDGCVAEDELVCDLVLGSPGGDQLSTLDLAWRELGLGGVIASFGLVLDIIGFVLS